jgi:hypothetical protein
MGWGCKGVRYVGVGINNPPVVKRDTQGTGKIWIRQFLLIKRVQACAHSSLANTQAQNG